MLRNFNASVMTIDGTPFRDGDKDVLLKTICCNALFAQEHDQGTTKRLDQYEHAKRYLLAQKIYGCEGKTEISSEDMSLLKTLISFHYPTAIVGAAIALLEGN